MYSLAIGEQPVRSPPPYCIMRRFTRRNSSSASWQAEINSQSKYTVMHPSNHKQPQATTSGGQLNSSNHKQPRAEGNSAQVTTSNHKRRATPLKQPQTTTSGGQLRSIIKQPQATLSCFTSKRRAAPLNDTKHSGDDLRSQRKCIADVLERPRRQFRDVGGLRQASNALRQHVKDLARSHNSAQRQ
jgi:hypothetical protein